MSATHPYLAQEEERPVRDWIGELTSDLAALLPVIFLVIVLLVGTILIVKTKGGLQKAIVFGLGAALVFLILTNVESVAAIFQGELPF